MGGMPRSIAGRRPRRDQLCEQTRGGAVCEGELRGDSARRTAPSRACDGQGSREESADFLASAPEGGGVWWRATIADLHAQVREDVVDTRRRGKRTLVAAWEPCSKEDSGVEGPCRTSPPELRAR